MADAADGISGFVKDMIPLDWAIGMSDDAAKGYAAYVQIYGEPPKDTHALREFGETMKPLKVLALQAGIDLDSASQDTSGPAIPTQYLPLIKKLVADPTAVANLTEFLKDPGNSIVGQVLTERNSGPGSAQLKQETLDRLFEVADNKQQLANLATILRTPGVSSILHGQQNGTATVDVSHTLDKLLPVLKDNDEVTNISTFLRNNSGLVAYAGDKSLTEGATTANSDKLVDVIIAAGKDKASLDQITNALNDKPDGAKYTLNEILIKIHSNAPDKADAVADLAKHADNLKILSENNVVNAIADANPAFKGALSLTKIMLNNPFAPPPTQGPSHVNIATAPLTEPTPAELALQQQKTKAAEEEKKKQEEDKAGGIGSMFANMLAGLIEKMIIACTNGEGAIGSHAKDIAQASSKMLAANMGSLFGLS